MKRLIMCEGPNELTLINILLENDALVFSEDDLLGLTAYHARQIKTSTQVQTALNLYDRNDVTVMRVGDKQTDRLVIPADYKVKICSELNNLGWKSFLQYPPAGQKRTLSINLFSGSVLFAVF